MQKGFNMTTLATETNPTHRQMAQAIIGPIQMAMNKTKKAYALMGATGLERTTCFELLGHPGPDGVGKVLKQENLKNLLEKAYRERYILRGNADYQNWMKRAYGAKSEQLDFDALTAWGHLATAISKETSPAVALCLGIGAQKVLEKWLREPPKAPLYFSASREDVHKKIKILMNRLQQLLRDHPKPPDGLFPMANNNLTLITTSYQLLRARLASDAIAWAYHTAPSVEARTKDLAKVYNEGTLSSDLEWLASLQPDEIAWRNGPFMLASHASAWSETARTLECLLQHFPKFLTTSVSGLTALAEDLDAWPGLATVYTTKNGNLGRLRHTVDQLRQERPSLDVALDLAAQSIHDRRSYAEIIAHIKERLAK